MPCKVITSCWPSYPALDPAFVPFDVKYAWPLDLRRLCAVPDGIDLDIDRNSTRRADK